MATGTILVVDDSPLTIETVRLGLEAAGFAVRQATDLADIPRPLPAGELDLVLMDVEMAEAFGDDLAAMMRDDGGPPIYLLSALDEAELAERAGDAGIDGYISKHQGVEQIVSRVESILGRDTRASVREVRGALLPAFVTTAIRRVRRARDARQAAYELHALIGEAAVLGFPDVAELAQRARSHAPGRDTLLDELDVRVAAIAAVSGSDAREPSIRADRGVRPRVLLLDDSDLYRATLGAILEDEGFAVTEAASCAELRNLVGQGPYALVIVDVELRDGSGIELIPEVRAALPRTRLVVLSGGEVLTVPEGADLALLKTLDPTSLSVKLHRLLDAPA